MRRSTLIFLAAILLPSLGLAWLAIHSVRDQQVVLEHQQAIISQGMTDALAQNTQDRMDQIRDDFAKSTRQLLAQSGSPWVLASDFNHKIGEAWPMAEVGFAVDLNGDICSPKSSEGAKAKTFRSENDRFLSNQENVEVYSQNSNVTGGGYQTSARLTGNSASLFGRNAARLKANLKAGQQDQTSFQDEDKIEEVPKKISLKFPAPSGLQSKSTLSGSLAPITATASPTVEPDLTPPAAATSVPTAPGSTTSIQAPLPAGAAVSADTLKEKATPAPSVAPAPVAATTPVAQVASAASPASALADSSMVDQEKARTVHASDSPSSSFDLLAKNIQQFGKIQRKVMPQQMLTRDTATLSNTVPEESDFRRVIGNETSGALARFLENNLRLMVWCHPAAASSIVFGAQIDQARLIEALKATFPSETQDRSYLSSTEPATCLAILDDTGHPVALSKPGFSADWKHPFVATEIGEALPHWEAALYLVDPQQIGRSARTLQLTLGLIVLLLVAAIVAGGSLIAADVRRQVRLAQQKTDFVSNVSHELKTPLTSIRMFADLLAEKRVPDEARQATYLRIIAAESARLTRLINNVLDFARMERGASPGERRACDLVEAARDVVETCQPHLEASGVSFQHEIEAETLPLSGDRDALSQIILNLVSNAEKYGGNDILVRVRRQETPTGSLGCVDVLDRGPGIPPSQVKTIFEPFHRLDDSLASGIPGSGLGLTLARRMARAHGGDITYSPRAGDGSCFTLSIPLTRS